MTTDSSIATLEPGPARGIEAVPDAIATSSRADHAAVWDQCIDALLGIWNTSGSIPEPAPSNATIDAAIRILREMRRIDPTNTPICIVPAPDGGIIVEWRNDLNGTESIQTVSFLNDGTIELVTYRDGFAESRTLEEGFPT
jgi:hypothetical protein